MFGLLSTMHKEPQETEKLAFENHVQLSKEEEKELATKFQQSGDKLAYQKLMMSLRPLAEREIQKASNSAKHVPRDVFGLEVYSRMPGIIKAYEPDKAQLNTFLVSKLGGYLKNTAGEFGVGAYVDRTSKQSLWKLQEAIKIAKMEFGPNPSDEQIKKHLQPSLLPRYDELKRMNVQSYVGDATYGEEEDTPVQFKDMFSEDTHTLETDITSYDMQERMRKLMVGKFSPQEQKAVEDVVFKNHNRAQVSLSYGIDSSTLNTKIREFKDLVNSNKNEVIGRNA